MHDEPSPSAPIAVLYTMDGCPHCVSAKEYLGAAGIRYVEARVDDPEERKAMYAEWNAEAWRAQAPHRSMPSLWLVWDGDATLVGGHADMARERLAENWALFTGAAAPASRLRELQDAAAGV